MLLILLLLSILHANSLNSERGTAAEHTSGKWEASWEAPGWTEVKALSHRVGVAAVDAADVATTAARIIANSTFGGGRWGEELPQDIELAGTKEALEKARLTEAALKQQLMETSESLNIALQREARAEALNAAIRHRAETAPEELTQVRKHYRAETEDGEKLQQRPHQGKNLLRRERATPVESEQAWSLQPEQPISAGVAPLGTVRVDPSLPLVSKLRRVGETAEAVVRARFVAHPRIMTLAIVIAVIAAAFMARQLSSRRWRAISSLTTKNSDHQMAEDDRNKVMDSPRTFFMGVGTPRSKRNRSTGTGATETTYPWRALPPLQDLLSAGPTFRHDMSTAIPAALAKRGLSRLFGDAGDGECGVSLVGQGEPRRGVLEPFAGPVTSMLGHKRRFAAYLAKEGLEHLGPATFLSPSSLREHIRKPGAKESRRQNGTLPVDAVGGLWFLKHVERDDNSGVSCFRGAKALLAHWEGPGVLEKDRQLYVAQAEVREPMLLSHWLGREGDGMNHKVTVRAYVLLAAGGRRFLHRELLLKSHPKPYTTDEADWHTHVVSCVKHEGVTAARGSASPLYGVLWPRIRDVVASCFSKFEIDAHEATYQRSRWFWPYWANYTLRARPGCLQYKLIGVDLIVDRSSGARPWIIEVNTMPAMAPERSTLANSVKAGVLEDLSSLLVDPVLRSVAEGAPTKDSKWNDVREWAAKDRALGGRCDKPGFVELRGCVGAEEALRGN
jgi:hypothetical protein